MSVDPGISVRVRVRVRVGVRVSVVEARLMFKVPAQLPWRYLCGNSTPQP